jgi:hypothetical protein
MKEASAYHLRPPSPAPTYAQSDLLESLLRRMGELEEKLDILQKKQSQMPSDKQEMLEAAVRRVDALEAELISTKKVHYSQYIPIDNCSIHTNTVIKSINYLIKGSSF